MKKPFYSHLVCINDILELVGTLDVTAQEKKHLCILMESTHHHAILDAILSELNKDDRKKFIQYLESEESDKIMKYLHSVVDSIEEKIVQASEKLKIELHKDIEEVKKDKNLN